jgi:hypothetical protein
MSDDEDVIEAEETFSEEMSDEPERRNGHGPGLLLGVMLGTAAGAAAAVLLARGNPALEAPPEGAAASPLDGARRVLYAVRARLHDAAQEGREAAREKEAELMSRYDELTR